MPPVYAIRHAGFPAKQWWSTAPPAYTPQIDQTIARSRLGGIAGGALAVGLYVLVGKASLLLASLHPSSSPVWPPTGLALAMLLLFGRRLWPAVFLGAFLVNALTEGSLATSLAIAAGNTLEAVMGATLVRAAWGEELPFRRVEHVASFWLAAMAAAVVSASVGVASLALGGYVARDALAPVWVTWWLGDTVGALTVTPFLLLWREPGSQRWTSARLAEAAGVCAAVLFIAAAVFGRPLFQDAGGSPLAYLALLPVLWAALRFGARETVTVILLLSGVAIAGTLQGWGPFVNDTRNSSLLHLQSFLGVATLIGLFLSTVRREQAARWDELERRVDERTGELELAYERAQVHAQRLRDMMDCLTVAAVAADEGLRVLHVNDCFRRLFNLESDPAEGVPIARILERVTPAFAEPQETMDLFRCWLRDLRPARRPELALADGRLLACEYIPTVSRRKDRGHLLVLRDVTEERRVDRAKSEFMSLASHQLRTPLTGIRWSLGRLERLLRDRLLEPERRLLSDGRQAAARMGETIDRMLAIARMESRQRSAQPQEAGLAELLEAAAADCRRAAEAKGQALAIHCQDGLVLRTDPKLLGEIVGNLLGNAVKYTPPGGRIALRVISASGTVRIAVEDSGIGIPADEQSSVFRKFFRAENARTLDQEGTGLGLYFAAGAARLLGARLTFHSRPGEGTVFTLEHPAGPLSAQPQPERHKREPVVV